MKVANLFWLTENVSWEQSFTFRESWGVKEESAFVFYDTFTWFFLTFNKMLFPGIFQGYTFQGAVWGQSGAKIPGRNKHTRKKALELSASVFHP